MRQDNRPPHDGEIDPREEHQAPGGAAVNRVAGVATSAVLGGATAGAVAGVMAGPVGAAVGAAVGAVAAGIAGNAVLESIDVRVEESHWRDHFHEQPYVEPGAGFDDYAPAYRFGLDAYVKHPDLSFEEAEAELSAAWAASRGGSALEWDQARHATRDGWQRVAVMMVRTGPEDGGDRRR